MQGEGGGEGGVVQAVRAGDLQERFVWRVSLENVAEVDRRPGCSRSVPVPVAYLGGGFVALVVPCNRRDVPSGMYLIKNLRRRYTMRP